MLVFNFAAGLLAFFIVVHLVVRFLARRDGFKHSSFGLESLGPVLFAYRWGSVRIGLTRWGRNVRITGYTDHIHLRLMPLFGGGEILLPLAEAEFSFSQGLYGEVVDVTIGDRTFGFGRDVAKMVKQHYC